MSMLKCSHCQQKFDKNAMIKSGSEYFCCTGCESVWQLLHLSGLEEFYDRLGDNELNPAKDVKSDKFSFLNSNKSQAINTTDDKISTDCPTLSDIKVIADKLDSELLDIQEFETTYAKYIRVKDKAHEISLVIEGISCSACVWLLEKLLTLKDGILEISINSTNQKANIVFDPQSISLSYIINLISRVGYKAMPFDAASYEERTQKKRREFYSRLLVGLFGLMNIMWIAVAQYSGYFSGMSESIRLILNFAEFILATPVLFYTGSGFFAGLRASILGRHANMDALVASGALSTYIYSVYAMLTRSGEVYFDSVAMIITFVFIGKFFESTSKKSATDAFDTLLARLPSTVMVKRGEGFISVNADSVSSGEIIRLCAGDMALLDGVCKSGEASFDTSMITGESLPAFVEAGGEILSGSICINGNVLYRCTQSAKNSLIGRLLDVLWHNLSKKPRIEELANKISSGFSLAIIGLAVLTFVYYLFSSSFSYALIIGVSVIVIACPCALSLATPVSTVVALSIGFKNGILFRYASIIEALCECDTVVFDKTGTLTTKELKVSSFSYFAPFDEGILLSITQASTHPVSVAIAGYLKAKGVMPKDVCGVRELAGRGVMAYYKEREIAGGSSRLMRELGISLCSGSSGYYFAIDGVVLASFELSSALRDEAKDSVRALFDMGLDVMVLSGDTKASVAKSAQELGISSFKSCCLPEDKASEISRLKEAGRRVLMVGDGINDALALSEAHVAVAMSTGADVSLNTSDVILLNDSLKALVFAVRLARASMRKVRINLGFCFVYNALSIPLAMTGYVVPLVAAVSMSLSSLVVVLNSLSLGLKFKGKI
ncbi:heavy metal translocating P-type ATPase [Campylobacter sp. 19-13652]|uniref:heavy metal translocating P-type ATPase n=1 Tax=Campylobacter sp. 19-13652 TaxID=2840180 RepID=UPI001C76BE5B|nr:heavy metal translocating P-type ATPase [Campylobacter sp. 19-13652]BCX80062.1 copper-translocating P-type ATPase [Campylobacter sp. 19-13652]